MSEVATTSNGHELTHSIPLISAAELKQRLASEYGISGDSPQERLRQLKHLSTEGIAILLEDINKSVQGSAESLMSHDETMKIGGRETIPPEYRYDVFNGLVADIKETPDDLNPERVGDVLALGTVLLHPFHDGNGRTARVIGLLFRDDYESDDYQSDFDTLIEPRDAARAAGGMMINGYVPFFPDGFDQSNPHQVSEYLSDLLQHENEKAYNGPYGQAPLRSQAGPSLR